MKADYKVTIGICFLQIHFQGWLIYSVVVKYEM
jgi:hypothetical protein